MSALRLSDERYAIATNGGGIFVLDTNGRLVQVIDQRSGLARQSVNGIFEDRQGNLWIGMNGGLSLIEIHHPITIYDENNGLEGIPIDVYEVNGIVYVASSLGLYKLTAGQFEPVEGLQAPTWGLNVYTDATDGRDKLLVGNQFGLWLKDGDVHVQLQPNFVTIGLQSRYHAGRIYYGTTIGLGYLQKNVETNRYEPVESAFMFNNSVRQILEDEHGGVWVALQADGLRYLPPGFDADDIREYRADEQGRNLGNATLAFRNGHLYLTNNIDLYRYDPQTDRFIRWVYPGLSEDDFAGTMKFLHSGESLFIGSALDRRFITEYRNINSDTIERFDAVFRSVPESVTLMVREMKGDIWFAQTTGLYRYDRNRPFSASLFDEVQIRRVEVIGDSTLVLNPLFLPEPRLSFSNSRIRFTVSAPWFDADNFMEYRYRLEGLDAQWSDWSPIPFVEYTALREGTYTFTVEARNREGIVGQAAYYPIQIQPPWFRNSATRGLGLIFLFAIVIMISRSYSEYSNRRLQAFNRKLEDEVNRRSQEIRRQNEVLQLMNQEKNDFMNIAAHDLRNPLSAIQGIVGMMQEYDDVPDRDELSEYVQILGMSSDRMYELIENYLNVHKIEQGDIKADITAVCLKQLANQAADRFRQIAQKKDMQFDIPPANGSAFSVFGDVSLTAQVLDNLISNAVKYSPFGSVITIQFEALDGYGAVTVIDQGPGIPAGKQHELFRKFSKIGSKPTGGEVSTGLGLSIVKKLARMMGGDVEYLPEVTAGAAFRFILPIAEA